MNWRNKSEVVVKETLVSKDKTYVVRGNMLVDQYVAVYVRHVSKLGDERLVRPYEIFKQLGLLSIKLLPRSHVSLFPCKRG